ncbi:adenylate/guanylate cyclase domain-containing protein [Myxococcota bacterium]|nr:adenylate/guanylate cyclase domain-containing protein [Myxococcota bacterium]
MEPWNPSPVRMQKLLTVPAEVPGRGFVAADVAGVHLFVGLITVLYAAAVWSARPGTPPPVPWLALFGALTAYVAVAGAWGWVIGDRWQRLRDELKRGVSPEELPALDIANGLTLHRPLSHAAFAQALVVCALAAAGLGLGGAQGWDIWAHVLAGMVFVVINATVAVRYRFLVLHIIGLCGLLLPSARLDRLPPTPLERMIVHIALLSFVLGGALPAILLLMGVSELTTEGMLLLVGGMHLLNNLLVAALIGRTVGFPAGQLESRMREVSSGRLDVRARVFGVDTFGALATHFNEMVEGLQQRERIREIFGRYVTRQVADEILSGRVPLGGQRTTATVLFADIRGFTRLSEEMDPEEVVALLNEYLGAMVTCVLDGGGVVDKYIGDAIMALFGVPVSLGTPEADAQAAVRCAVQMSEALDRLNARRVAAGGAPVELGIGVHTGEVVAGNIGIPERMEYTVIGDTVNLCARIEGLTRDLGVRVLLSKSCVEHLGDSQAVRFVETVAVKGRLQPVTVYTLAS